MDKVEKYFQDKEKEFLLIRYARGSQQFPLIYSFLIESGDDLILKSFTLYTSELCGIPQLIEINRFSEKMSKWTTEDFFFIDKVNFNNCPLVFGILQDIPNALNQMKAVAKYLQRSLNFSASFIFLMNNENNVVVDYELFDTFISDNLFNEGNHFTFLMNQVRFSLTVPYGELYTQLEKSCCHLKPQFGLLSLLLF